MNIIAIDIGNTNIAIGLFLAENEQFIKSIAGQDQAALTTCLRLAWKNSRSPKAPKKESVRVSSSSAV